MDQGLLNKFKQILQQEKKKLQARLDQMENRALEAPLQESIGELSMYDNHPADLGSETFERSKDLALREQAEIRLREIENALTHMDEGTYGFCDRCGAEIPVERLEAMPSATVCKKCKEAEERLPDRHPRPIEEDVIAPPFGGPKRGRPGAAPGRTGDKVMFDGEDTWQAVARYGTSETPQDLGIRGVNDYKHMYIDADENTGAVEQVEELPDQ